MSTIKIIGRSEYCELTACITMEAAHQLMVNGLKVVYEVASEKLPDKRRFIEGQIEQHGFFPHHIEFNNIPENISRIDNPIEFPAVDEVNAVDMAGLVEMARLRYMEENSHDYPEEELQMQRDRVGALAKRFARLALNGLMKGEDVPLSADDLEAVYKILNLNENGSEKPTFH